MLVLERAIREHISTEESSYAGPWLFRRDGTIPPHRLDTVWPRSGGGGLWWSDGRRSLSSLGGSAGSERVRVVVDGRAGHGDAAHDLWPGRHLRLVSLSPGHHRAGGGNAACHVSRPLLAGARYRRGAERTYRPRRLARGPPTPGTHACTHHH